MGAETFPRIPGPPGETGGWLDKVLRRLTDTVLLVDPGGTILWATDDERPRLRLGREDLLGRRAADLVVPGDRDAVRAALAAAVGRRPGDPVELTVRAPAAEGDLLIRVVLDNLLADPEVGALVAVCTNITDQAVRERTLEVHLDLLGGIATGVPVTEIVDRLRRDLPRAAGLAGIHVRFGAVDPVDGPTTRPVHGPGGIPLGTVTVVPPDGAPPGPHHVWVAALAARTVEVAVAARRRATELRRSGVRHPRTGLLTREAFVDRLRALLRQVVAGPAPVDQVAVVVVNLDDLELVGDAHGAAAAEQVIAESGRRLTGAGLAGPVDHVADLGGGVLAVAVAGQDPTGDAARAALARIRDALGAPVEVAGRRLTLRTSIGVARAGDGAGAADLLARAEAAARRARRRPGRVVEHEPADQERAERFLAISERLEDALAEGAVTVVHQPIVAVPELTVAGAEVLARWTDPVLGPVPPGEFVAVAEARGLTGRLTRLVLDRALAETARLARRGLVPPGYRLHVNVNPSDLAGLPDLIRDRLAAHDIGGAVLCVELTERVLATEDDTARSAVRSLRGLGVEVAIDDFGTGWSSLAYLDRFAVSALKVDRSFVTSGGEGFRLAAAVIGLARALDLEVVTEGVETVEALRAVVAHGCWLVQGFLFSPGVGVDDLARLLAEPPWGDLLRR